MKKTLLAFILLLVVSSYAMSQTRRPIDAKHPMWLVHIDVWNYADPQKIIDLIPDDIKPYTVMNLSLSSSYDKDADVYTRPADGVATFKSWASVCQANDMWFTCQPASGGHTHIHDNDIETFEYFFKKYPNFLGWNYAEQFWGFDEHGDKSSSSQVERLALFAKLVEMSHRYGGFLTISYCGNVQTHALNPIGMMKRNSDLYQACAQYPEAILWLYKYTTSSCFYNNESVTFGPFVSGLASNYGVRYDKCGYTGVLADLLGDNNSCIYPISAGIGTVMEQMGVNGGAVWDGPELIWTEDFHNLSNTTVNGYTHRNWERYPGFDNAWIDMFRKVIDGTICIPSRSEVVNNTPIIIINDISSGTSEEMYGTWADLYDGLYKQSDPFNRGNGQLSRNGLYLKSTGRYGTIPVTLALNDDLANSISYKVKRSDRWTSNSSKVSDFEKFYPEVSQGDLYVNRYKNQLITYTPFSYLNEKTQATGVIPLKYNTATSMTLTWGKLSSATVREYRDHIDFYLNNYRTDTIANVVDRIVVDGVTSTPAVTFTPRGQATAEVTNQYDAENHTLTVEVAHNGPVDVTLTCSGDAKNRLTDTAPNTPLTADLPKQPEPLADTKVIIEAEDMDYKDLASGDDCILTPYYNNKYKDIRGHIGNGFMHTGTKKTGELYHSLTRKADGEHRIYIRYSTEANNAKLTVTVNGQPQTIDCPRTGRSVWRKAMVTANMISGANELTITNTGGKDMMIDNVTYIPSSEANESYQIVIRDVANGTAFASKTEATEGETVKLSANPDENYILSGWNIIHGNITIDEDGNFEMPDDIVTLSPIFSEASTVYAMELEASVSIPVGWRCVQENGDVHEYPNTYSSGSRTLTGFTNTNGNNKALYWRNGYAEYGNQADYPLTLEDGSYRLAFAMGAWKLAPYYVAEILASDGETLIATSESLLAAPNADGNTSADLSSCEVQTLDFDIEQEGNYIIRFRNMDAISGYDEFLLVSCVLNRTDVQASIQPIVITSDGDEIEAIYDLNGIRLPAMRKGINIVRTKKGNVSKILLR